MEGKDYAEIVANFIGDSAGAVPVCGGFITAVKNVGINIASVKQRERIEKALQDLAMKIDNIVEKFDNLSNDESFLVHFYKIMYLQKDNTDKYLSELYLEYLKKYINGDFKDVEKEFLFNIVTSLTAYSLKYLHDFYEEHKIQWVSLKEKYHVETEYSGIDYNQIDFKYHRTLIELTKLGIFEERHHLHCDKNSSGYLEDVKISKLGIELLSFIEFCNQEKQ